MKYFNIVFQASYVVGSVQNQNEICDNVEEFIVAGEGNFRTKEK